MEVFGGVIYTGDDHDARKGSAFFGGTDRARWMMDQLNIPVKSALSILETCFKYVFFILYHYVHDVEAHHDVVLRAEKLSQSGLRSAFLSLLGGKVVSGFPVKVCAKTRDSARTSLSTILLKQLGMCRNRHP